MNEIEELKEKLASAEAAGAEMRSSLIEVVKALKKTDRGILANYVDRLTHRNDLGQGWKSPAEFAALQAEINALKSDIHQPELCNEKIDQLTKERDDAIHERKSCHELYDEILRVCGHDPSKGHPMITHAVAAVVKERDEAVEKLIKPGVWECEECGFEIVKSVISAADGKFSCDNRHYEEFCPNDGTGMIRQTWENHAKGLEKALDKISDPYEKELSRLRSEIERKDAAIKNLLIVHDCGADETGYVADVGFIDIDAIVEEARAALAPAGKEDATPSHDGPCGPESSCDMGCMEAGYRAKEATAHEQHISPKQYRDLVPGVDRWQAGDEAYWSDEGWRKVRGLIGTSYEGAPHGRRPLPEVPEGWTLSEDGLSIERKGDGRWIVPPSAIVDSTMQGKWVESKFVGKPSTPWVLYRLPWPPKQEVAPEPASPWISQPTEPGLWWLKRDGKEADVVEVWHYEEKVWCDVKVGNGYTTHRLDGLESIGQFQGPIKPQEGGK